MNRGQTHVAVIYIIGALATWSVGLSIAIFNDHASLASVQQSVQDIKDTLDNKVVPDLEASSYRNRYVASSTNE